MAKDYKKIIDDKRLEAGNLMTQSQLEQSNAAIHIASIASAASGFIPVPVADAVPISAAQVTMVIALGGIFDQEITSAAAKGLIGAAAATFVGRNLVKLIPVVGWGVSAAIAAGVTEAIGWTIAVDMATAFRKEWERQKNAKEAADAYAEAQFYKNAAESDDFEAEDFADV
ncbi:MAG: hypothetical protein IKG18_01930 [Atopobiaceae bacterium]|nr:hypothetical protein [Atopobiaceae bacterium]